MAVQFSSPQDFYKIILRKEFFETKVILISISTLVVITAELELELALNDDAFFRHLKFSFSEKATKICEIFLMILMFTK